MEGEQLFLFPFNNYEAPKNQTIIDFDGALMEVKHEEKTEEPIKIDSVKQAAIVAVANRYAKNADFSELDVKTAEIMLRAMAEFYRKFPKVPPLDFISDKSRIDKWIRRKKATILFNGNSAYYRGMFSQYSDPGIIANIAAMMKKKERKKGIYETLMSAIYLGATDDYFLEFNPLFLDNGEITEARGKVISNREGDTFHPVKSFNVKGVINHELGHVLTRWLGAEEDSFISHLYRSLSRKRAITSELSEYAKTNQLEFIAEAWSEYTTNPKPRHVALEVGKRLEGIYAHTESCLKRQESRLKERGY